MHNSEENYTFQYTAGDRDITVSFTPGDTWHEVLEQFVSFLGNIYGYDVRDKIAIKENPFALYENGWSGPVFDKEDIL
jgi:hypothetical protein